VERASGPTRRNKSRNAISTNALSLTRHVWATRCSCSLISAERLAVIRSALPGSPMLGERFGESARGADRIITSYLFCRPSGPEALPRGDEGGGRHLSMMNTTLAI
jgi:hypothetical protein